MKNIRVVCNYSVAIHANRFIHDTEVNLFHLDVKNYGVNQSDNILDDLDTNLIHLVLTNNPLTALKLYTRFPNDVSFCIMDPDCVYKEVENPSISKLIELFCNFTLPDSFMTQHGTDSNGNEYIDCTVSEPAVESGWVEINQYISQLQDINILMVSNLDKFIHTTKKNVKVGFLNYERGLNDAKPIANALKNIEIIIVTIDLKEQMDDLLDKIEPIFDLNPDYNIIFAMEHEDKTIYVR